ncbi:Multidrug resistance-associated protein 1, partial [Actinomortierella wolfii]
SIKSTSTLDSEQTTTQENKSDAHQAARQSTKQGGPSAKDGELVEKEKVTADNLGWDLYNEYAKAASWDNVILAISLAMVAQAFQVGTNLWLRQWVEDTKEASETGSMAHSAAYYLLVYAFLVALSLVLALVGKLLSQTVAGLRAAIIIHERLLNHVLRLPMSFFDTTPVGRILNRFSSDISGIDSRLPREFDDLFTLGSMVLGTIIVIGMSTPAFLILVPFLCLAYGFIQNHYLKTSSSLKTMYQVTKSPVYSHFSETITGVSSIRIMDGAKSRFIARAEDLGDAMTQSMAAYMAVNRWVQIRLEMIGAVMVFASALLSVWSADTLDAALIGIALSYAITVTIRINFLVRTAGEIQNLMVSLDRVYEYTYKPTEAPAETGVHLPERWPQAGHIKFNDYSTRYRQGLDLVVKHISFEVQPGEKIGIVGRTGAGKSSLTLALFRIIEAANSYWAKASQDPNTVDTSLVKSSNSSSNSHLSDDEIDGGSIVIDGVDISTVGLNYLRQHLSIIPQEPTLFAGTLRENLDPFNEKQDADLWRALERAHLKDYASTLQGGLSFEVAQNGENFSVGQRSLLCLARALLRDTSILVLDEATSSVDMQTDELIQRTIRTEFKDRTILTIAHRIKTVMDYDKILVLEKGRLVEFESPPVLLQRKDSLFYGLAKQAGEIKE